MAKLDPSTYDTLLRVRKTQENLRAQALASARREVQAAMEQRDDILRQQQWMLDQAGARLQAHFDAGDLRRIYQHERHLALLGDEKDIQIRQLEVEAEERRQDLEAAAKRRQMVERLQERKQAAYRMYVNKLEQQQLDETAAAYAARRIVPGQASPGRRERER